MHSDMQLIQFPFNIANASRSSSQNQMKLPHEIISFFMRINTVNNNIIFYFYYNYFNDRTPSHFDNR